MSPDQEWDDKIYLHIKGVEMSPILAAYKYFIAIKWPVSHALFGSLSRGPAR
jgi:hypothetical protein